MFGKVKAYRKKWCQFFGPPCIMTRGLKINRKIKFVIIVILIVVVVVV